MQPISLRTNFLVLTSLGITVAIQHTFRAGKVTVLPDWEETYALIQISLAAWKEHPGRDAINQDADSRNPNDRSSCYFSRFSEALNRFPSNPAHGNQENNRVQERN